MPTLISKQTTEPVAFTKLSREGRVKVVSDFIFNINNFMISERLQASLVM